MKNIINYYYKLIPNNITQSENNYYFEFKNSTYYLINIPYQIEEKKQIDTLINIYNLHIFLINNGIKLHQIILNKLNNIISPINNKNYILLKLNNLVNLEKKINFESFKPFNKLQITPTSMLINIDFTTPYILWTNKNDYLEYQVSMLGKKYPLIKESFDYYIGIAETAITLLNNINFNNIPLVPAHKRISINYTYLKLYNPLNIIIDSRIRDITEYFKSNFFKNKNITFKIYYFLNNNNLNKDENILFLARMLYPTYYFDLFEQIITNKKEEKEIKKITSLTNDYERMLKNIYYNLKNKYNIENIEWLE